MQVQESFIFDPLDSNDLNKKSSNTKRAFVTTLSILLVGVALSLSINGIKLYVQSTEPVTAYLELRVLSENGRPVAGAEIFDRSKSLGSTDSFGELRRELRVVPKDGLHILVEKKQVGGNTLSANKKIDLASGYRRLPKIDINSSIHVH